MNGRRAIEYGPYAVAAGIALTAALVTGVFDFVPGLGWFLRAVASILPVRGPNLSLLFVGLPLLLALSLVLRAACVTAPVNVMLAVAAVPCLLVCLWALYSAVFTSSGVYFGGLFAMVAETLLAIAVLVDGLLSRVGALASVRRRTRFPD
ncbi:hypothetical protein A4G99_13620 [Haladaptatus sp. R4]|uniref:hypothetical protein n=1 Tax=Haladaptatus sp. R4 TaxID=1679489 RepID=UPI0007B48A7D|nr:hypothetical protein [Haladaptatus sp. R4]KZN23874.1 hypothetical protein A4G99_13620 [Haladaptatus sp. R4]